MLLSCGLLEYVPYTTVPTNPSVAGCQAFPAGTRRTNVQPLPYEPVAQAVHVPEEMSMKPTLHVQEVTTVLGLGELELAGHARQVDSSVAPAVAEYLSAAQSVQTALPVVVLYLPATHAVHGPPLGPVNPTLQVQAMRVKLAIGELELVGHVRQVVATVAPTVVEYVPAPQSVQTALPVAILYFPATHAVHGPPLGPVYPALQAGLIQAALDVLAIGEVVPAGHVSHTPPSQHPVTCSSAKCKLPPPMEKCRYRPRSVVVHIASAM